MRSLVCASFLAFAAACVGSGTQRVSQPGAGFQTIHIDGPDASYDLRYLDDVSPVRDQVGVPTSEAWNALPQVYVDLGIPLAGVNGEARLLGNSGFYVRDAIGDERVSRYLRCGHRMTGSVADQADVYLRVLTQLRPMEGHEGTTEILTLVAAAAQPPQGSSVRCESTGQLEHTIAKRLKARLVGIAGSG